MKHIFALILLTSFTLTACDGLFTNDDCNNCRNVNCTEEFKLISINVIDKIGDPVVLNEYKLTYTKSGDEVDLNGSDNNLIAPGNYTIATDAMMNDLECDGTSITFSYSLDGETFNSESFLIGKDCCHIQWRDDKVQEIVID